MADHITYMIKELEKIKVVEEKVKQTLVADSFVAAKSLFIPKKGRSYYNKWLKDIKSFIVNSQKEQTVWEKAKKKKTNLTIWDRIRKNKKSNFTL